MSFKQLMGCEDWLMRLIMEISTLSEWKRRLEASDTLNMWELFHRASNIERRIQVYLTAEARRQRGAMLATTTAPNTPKPISNAITRVFASAALVYLQVTISVPHPKLPDI
jgi:hypothetical protein